MNDDAAANGAADVEGAEEADAGAEGPPTIRVLDGGSSRGSLVAAAAPGRHTHEDGGGKASMEDADRRSSSGSSSRVARRGGGCGSMVVLRLLLLLVVMVTGTSLSYGVVCRSYAARMMPLVSRSIGRVNILFYEKLKTFYCIRVGIFLLSVSS
mmetsp:Transcript_15985/g.32149  ORF Transcript_15985/g.32149 Transcript_15985/m.32149 type:complete len:154 (-) Transcript_15985:98-559(-)